MNICLNKIANLVLSNARETGWSLSEMRMAETGSIYIELVRDGKEWVVVRIADHNQAYNRWITTYSVSPSELSVEEMDLILKKPFGEVGDVLL